MTSAIMLFYNYCRPVFYVIRFLILSNIRPKTTAKYKLKHKTGFARTKNAQVFELVSTIMR